MRCAERSMEERGQHSTAVTAIFTDEIQYQKNVTKTAHNS
jgi:hypothetical protein